MLWVRSTCSRRVSSISSRDVIDCSATDRRAVHCTERVCPFVCVCLSVHDHIFGTTCQIFTKFCARYLWLWLDPHLAA